MNSCFKQSQNITGDKIAQQGTTENQHDVNMNMHADECKHMQKVHFKAPDRRSKFLVRETWSKKLGYTSHTQNHPSFSYGKHGGRQKRRFSCSYKSVAVVFPALNDKITQLNSTQLNELPTSN